MDQSIHYYSSDIDFTLDNQEDVSLWINTIASRFKYIIREVNITFCSDEYLLKLNKEYLNHDFYTDILTFPLSVDKIVIADIVISIDRVKENAQTLKVPFIDELHRVLIHGVLHLVGLDDTTKESQKSMRAEEDLALSLRMF